MTRTQTPVTTEPDEEMYRAYVGTGWSHYGRAFALLRRQAPFGAWNWAAALVPFWLAYRKMFGLQIVFALAWARVSTLAVPLLRGLGPVRSVLAAHLMSFAVMALAGGLLGDYLVYWRARRAALKAATTTYSRRRVLARLRRDGNVSVGRAAVVSLLTLIILGVAVS